MRFLLVNSRMDEVEESDKVMGDRCPSKAPTVGRIKKRYKRREEPIAEKSFVHFAEEWGARDVSPCERPVRQAPDRSIIIPDRPITFRNMGPVRWIQFNLI